MGEAGRRSAFHQSAMTPLAPIELESQADDTNKDSDDEKRSYGFTPGDTNKDSDDEKRSYAFMSGDDSVGTQDKKRSQQAVLQCEASIAFTHRPSTLEKLPDLDCVLCQCTTKCEDPNEMGASQPWGAYRTMPDLVAAPMGELCHYCYMTHDNFYPEIPISILVEAPSRASVTDPSVRDRSRDPSG